MWVVGNRVVVEVEAGVGGLADLDLDTLIGGIGICGQREQPGAAPRRRRHGRCVAMSSGQWRSAATPVTSSLAWALRSSRSVYFRAAKKLSRT